MDGWLTADEAVKLLERAADKLSLLPGGGIYAHQLREMAAEIGASLGTDGSP